MGEGRGGRERGGEGDASTRTLGYVRADAPCFVPGNFKKDATVRPSHIRLRGHRPIICPSVRKCPRDNHVKYSQDVSQQESRLHLRKKQRRIA
jgi:hypothetical protein